MGNKTRVLFLPRWYPHRYDPMPGLFIRRQAEALTPFCDVAVIYIHPDPECPNKYEVEFSEENEVRVLRVYYKVPAVAYMPFSGIYRMFRFYRAAMKAVNSISQFAPQVVHAHILTRMGFIAWRVSRKFRIPFLISEHWSRYFPENGTYSGCLRKLITRFIVKRAAIVIPVSENLKSAMLQQLLFNSEYRVIPNVVDTSLFTVRPKPAANEKKTFLHISCFEDKSKNISGLLRVLRSLSLKRQDFECRFVGEGPDFIEMQDYARELGIFDTFAFFMGTLAPSSLAEYLGTADFTVLSSHYETFGTVVVESLSCGIPVVATSTGIAETLVNSRNGLLVHPGDETALLMAVDQMLDRSRSFDRMEVRTTLPDGFSADCVGKSIAEIYHMVVHSKKVS